VPANSVHHLKSWPASFDAIWSGRRRFDVRRDDRSYLVGDVLVLQEWDEKSERHTGREVVAKVTDVWRDWHLVGLAGGDEPVAAVVMGITGVSWSAYPAQRHAIAPEEALAS